ncbi:transcription factor IIA, alpha/beta subunit [Annulohypoxylon maeteangense]|uniref:transcription factor IIA, alpha/beta subunit n=1 Tax=Annulohypoxylon maeteangense TaxID=1927788 RepID=UPI0020087839|nr:transcription factor IIA, alpha/beta subunit [Annulohypoxylon maeteangense]KAI0881217.1 transcription factor IIA, alpha/beta subunit [Annulohypoxylon maeteangense]
MSNSQVGNVYSQIITDVLEASRVDFEEGGVDETVLEELKKGWQKKLSQQQLAVFPWDPKPDPPAPAVAAPQPTPVPEPTPQAPTNGASYNQQHAPQPQGLTMPGSQPLRDAAIKSEPGVKTEPDLEHTPSFPQAAQQGGSDVVQERVSQQLQSMYGDRAAASIKQLQQTFNNGQPQNAQRPGGQPVPQNYPAQFQGHPQQQYRPTMPPNAQQQRAQMQNGQRPPQSQMDGANDDHGHLGVLMRRSQAGDVEMGRVEIDSLLHAQIAAKAKAMEGGGLMLPLKRTGKGKAAAAYHRTPVSSGPSQFDGTGADESMKDEVSDEDAINSDLDDPDDNPEEEDEDEDGGQIMLCMYDKVQRVKNKWKCVLKDGVLSVNGKDYVFHKATGEYEW